MSARLMAVGFLVAFAGVGPALAANGAPGGAGPVVTPGPASPNLTACRKARPHLSPEERAQRRAMRQQRRAARAARGLPPKKPHRQLPRC